MEPLDDVILCKDDLIEECEQNGRVDVLCSGDAVFLSEEDMRNSLARFCYGDLFTIGCIWIAMLKTVLVGSKFTLIPVVQAAKPPEPPQKPPKMRYKDLSLYDCPHHAYKDYSEEKEKCPAAKIKLLHQALLPHVKNLRKKSVEVYGQACSGLRGTCSDIKSSIESSKNDFKRLMRDPNNLQVRQGVVAGGTLIGYYLGGGGGVPRRVFYTCLGALATGSLCFPKETDDIFRNVAYHTSKTVLAAYNALCKKGYSLNERLPCRDDLPKPAPPKTKKPLCPQK